MKQLTTLLLLIFAMLPSFLQAQETITNESLIQMKDLGFSDDVIISKINSSDYKFETSIAELSKLKEAGISPEIISIVMEKSMQNTKSKTGIYYANANGEQTLLQPTIFSGTSTNSAAQVLVSGFINSKEKATLPKLTSNNVINSATPVFTFVFDVSSSGTDNMQPQQGGGDLFNWWFKTASSPNEFVLIKLKVKERKNLREVIMGKSSALSSSSGVDPQDALPFNIREIEGNKFEVTAETLEPGEYAFFYQGRVPGGNSNQAVFDFSVR